MALLDIGQMISSLVEVWDLFVNDLDNNRSSPGLLVPTASSSPAVRSDALHADSGASRINLKVMSWSCTACQQDNSRVIRQLREDLDSLRATVSMLQHSASTQ